MVRVKVPVVAVTEAVKAALAVHVGIQLPGENATDKPAGRGVRMLKVTGVVTPVMSVAVAVSTPLAPPGTIVKVAGEAARLNSKAHWPWGVTVKVTERVSEPLVPVTVTVSLPKKQLVLTVRVDARLLPGPRTRLD